LLNNESTIKMERIKALIDKLYQQKQQNCSPALMLPIVQLLQTELLRVQQSNSLSGRGKVVVTMPLNYHVEEIIEEAPPFNQTIPASTIEQVLNEIVKEPTPVYKSEYQQPVIEKIRVEEKKPEPVIAKVKEHQVLNPALDIKTESPTLTQHQVKELHEVIADPKESLNDKLKQEKIELAHVLKDTPIKDLRKGIGINDRFTFVNELFRGDEAMYERSIKTINAFNILSEAEYWINRELSFKLAWNDSKDIVQHFYHLVKRRFA
jgi:hypothetical protein